MVLTEIECWGKKPPKKSPYLLFKEHIEQELGAKTHITIGNQI